MDILQGLIPGLAIFYVSKTLNGVEEAAFNRHMQQDVKTSLDAMVDPAIDKNVCIDLGIIDMCSRRGRDGKDMPQKEGSTFPWIQFVHKFDNKKENTVVGRGKWAETMIEHLNKEARDKDWFKYDTTTFMYGGDITNNTGLLDHVSAALTDYDAALLFVDMFYNETVDYIDLFHSLEFLDFFEHPEDGRHAVLNCLSIKDQPEYH